MPNEIKANEFECLTCEKTAIARPEEIPPRWVVGVVETNDIKAEWSACSSGHIRKAIARAMQAANEGRLPGEEPFDLSPQ